ncbi:hypothetical protein GCM10018790_18520 [Kitasatospora xanthocidica]|uniref:hypothetical protein n=1 Tax=Kitasatospora xanthocidica TaxID=83382 RepID=UPI0016792B5B|nr:hypothetical protein [Kitasatospora xanthocidica]GHF41188.1 hypothetical protein GCM10018790_18520 [Kitasatospora xanthocidica]
MGEFAPCPGEALKAAESICGPVTLTGITDRRGSAVWKATGVRGSVAIKAGHGEGEEITARESAVLDQLPGYTVIAGRYAGGVWYVTPWLAGPSTWDLFKPIRADGGDPAQALAGATALCRAVAELHSAAWVHGDLQPAHGVHTAQGAKLLDLSWAWSPTFPPSPIFQGGITHLVAPELAAAVESGERPVRTTTASDVYALAGTLWTCVTGRWPLDYDAAGIGPDAGPSARRAAIATGTIPLCSAPSWPTLLTPLRAVLRAPAQDRPTAAELGLALAKL